MLRKRLSMLLIAAVLTCAAACHKYDGVAIEGQLVDEQTKQPLSGATVAVIIETRGGWLHPSVSDNLLALEATTDERGRYAIPPWGPKVTFSQYLLTTQPTIVAFHREYEFWVAGNKGDAELPDRIGGTTVRSDWNGRTIELRRLKSEPRSVEENARLAERFLMLDFGPRNCTWERMPRLTAELVRRGELSRNAGIPSILPDKDSLYRSGACKQPLF